MTIFELKLFLFLEGGELVEFEGKLYKQFYGMSSSVAMNKHAGGVAEYRSSEGEGIHTYLTRYYCWEKL